MHFFKVVQKKLHFAAHGNTAAEVIYDRADADKPFMGLTTFKGEIPIKSDVVIAKNYLSAEELKVLNNLVSGYFDFAEIQAMSPLQKVTVATFVICNTLIISVCYLSKMRKMTFYSGLRNRYG